MAAQNNASGSDDEFHSLSVQGEDDGASDSNSIAMAPPIHPILSFQGAFEESIVESTDAEHEHCPDSDTDAEMRRRKLLEAERYEDVARTRWKQRPEAKYHPFVKLMAQVVFGMHLLKEGQAKSNEEVVKILQSHVNEVDGFLERTSDDFDLAIKDIEERIRYLKFPMQHMEVFQVMLDEKKFRTDLLNGNEKIEKIINRTAKAMKTALSDIECGIKSTKELSHYLTKIESRWPTTSSDIVEVFAAMRGNEAGWIKYLQDLQAKGNNLGGNLKILENVIGEISKHAAAASRRTIPQSKTESPGTSQVSGTSSPLRSKFAKDPTYRKPGPWLDKPLPKEPNTVAGASHGAISKPHPVPFETRYEQPRQRAPTPASRSTTNVSPPRPKTAGRATATKSHDANSRESMRELTEFLKNSGPLRSHPPDNARDGREQTRKPGWSQSQGGSRMMTSATTKEDKAIFRRSRSQGAIPVIKETDTKLIPRKPVGFAPVKGDQKSKSPTSTGHSQNGSVSSSNGFSRRLSRRLKNLPSGTNHTARKDSITRPIDSAYSSIPEKDERASEDLLTDHEKDSPDLEKDSAKDELRPSSKQNHSLFPKHTGPLTPSQASMRENSPSPPNKTWQTSSVTDNSSQPTHSTKASRTLSLRRFFTHRKGESRNVMVS